MAKMVTWLGEGDDGPHVYTWAGHRFEVGKPVKVTDEYMLSKVGPPWWTVEDIPGERPAPASKESKAKIDEITTKALDEAEEKIKAENEGRIATEFKEKAAGIKAQEKLADNEKTAAAFAQQKAAMNKQQRQPTSNNDDGKYREAN